MRKYGYILFGYCALATFLLIGVCCNFRFEETLTRLNVPEGPGDYSPQSCGGRYVYSYTEHTSSYTNPVVLLTAPSLVLGLVALLWIMPEEKKGLG